MVFRSLVLYLIAYAKSLFTAFHVYIIGIYYLLYEFFEDYRKGLKTTHPDCLYRDKCKEWARLLARRQEKERTEKENQVPDGNQDSNPDRRLVAVLTGADGTIGSEVVHGFLQFFFTHLPLKILNYLISLDFLVFAVGYGFPPDLYDHDNLQFIKCDLSARNEVFDAVQTIQQGCDQIDLLILNAAVFLEGGLASWMPISYRRDILGQNIIERHLAVNVLANAQLFASFSHQLEMSPQPRAIFLSSVTARAGDVSQLLRGDEEHFWCRHLNGYKAYADSKLLLSAYVKYLGRILKTRGSKISVASLHPGIVPGKFYRNVFWPARFFINSVLSIFTRSPRLAATQVLDLAFAEQLQSGAYYENDQPTPLAATEDPDHVWLLGKSVREMIVDYNGHSSTDTSNNNNTNTLNSTAAAEELGRHQQILAQLLEQISQN